jgi:hypothetical protein
MTELARNDWDQLTKTLFSIPDFEYQSTYKERCSEREPVVSLTHHRGAVTTLHKQEDRRALHQDGDLDCNLCEA